MPSQHANLSPSAAARWIGCPASIRMEAEYAGQAQDDESPYAREGTHAHTLCEIEASQTFGFTTRRQYLGQIKKFKELLDAENYPEGTYEEMHGHARSYVALLAERVKAHPGSKLLLEQRLNSGVEDCWGTSDAVIFSPDHVEIVDFKYGAGVPVSAIRNKQLRIYGLGALDTYGDILGDTETVTCTVHQPRLDSVSSETLTADELRAWREEVVRPAAALTREPDAPFGPSEEACRWCPVKNICRVRMETAASEDFTVTPEVVTEEELAEILHRLPMIKSWVSDMESHALDQAYSQGKHLPGWKVVMSGGKRSIVDPPRALERLRAKGFKLEDIAIVEPKPKALGVLEKIVGKRNLPEILGTTLKKGDGKPSLVQEKDPRPAISPASEAAADFAPVDDLL